MSSKTKKKLSEMSVDEFMESGLGSDVSDVEEEEPKKKIIKRNPKQIVTTKSESSTHKKQMERLKDKDPEFFKFLQENDDELLDFSGSDDDGSADDDNDDDDKEIDSEAEDANSDFDDKQTDDVDEEDVEGEKMDEEEPEEVTGKVVTTEMIGKWKESIEGGSLKTLKAVFKAFHASVENLSSSDEDGNDDTQKKKKSKQVYVVEGGALFNSLVALCFKHGVNVLEKHLDNVQNKKSKRTPLPSSSKHWSKVKPVVKQYLLDILQLLRQLTDPTVLSITIRHCQTLCPYYACFPKITKMFLKRLIRMWSSADEHVRVLAFLSIRKVTMLAQNLLEFSVKNLYLAFVRNSKFVNSKTKPTVMFMRNSLVEMFALNEAITYKHAFVYMRQLAIHLRNAMTVKKKDGHQSVYNWQYISCLLLWLHTLSELYGETLKPLVYPVVQITLGVIRLIPSARYYPLRFQCLDALNYLSKKTGVYIPIASYVLEALESKEFLKKPKSSEKPPDFYGVLKLSKAQLQTKGFQDVSIDRSFECLLEFHVNLSNSIAFPELIFPICHRLRHLIKSSKVFKLNKDMKSLIDKLNSHADTITKVRSQVSFSPKDIEAASAWESQQKSKKNTLIEFYDTWKRMKTVTDIINDDNEEDDDDEQPSPSNKITVGKKRKLVNDDKTDKKVTSQEKKKTKKKVEVKKTQASTEDDIVEDFQFSSDDDASENDD